jgi:geranylgeranyl reductase family protein
MAEPALAAKYDVVVVGGGPAGAAAAFVAARAGASVCLIDKAQFPRDKLCGGLLTERSRQVFEATFGRSWDWGLVGSSADVSFWMGARRLAEVDGYTPLHFTMRRAFDAHLVELAQEAGAELRLGCEVKGIDRRERAVETADGARVGYGCLIAADGVNSQVARALYGAAFDPATIGFGLEVEVPREALPGRGETVEIDFAGASWGYGWVFPKARSFTIGVGGVHAANPRLRQSLEAYLALKGVPPCEHRPKGQYIPFGDVRAAPAADGVLFCGDAAGFVDPITGEGIAYALQSGAAAGLAAAEAARTGRPAVADGLYQAAVAPIGRSIRQARFWRRLIFSDWARGPFAAWFGDASTLQHGFLDLLAGRREYDDVWGLMAAQAWRAARKVLPKY